MAGQGPEDKKARIRAEALEQLRKTRAKINEDHPMLLDKMRMLIEAQEQASQEPVEEPLPQQDLKIDRKKSVETVMKLLENDRSSSDFQLKVKEMLLKSDLGTRH